MPKERGMVFPYTKRGQEDAQKYREALSPEQEQMKRALEKSIAGQVQAIQDGIGRIRQQNTMKKILGLENVGPRPDESNLLPGPREKNPNLIDILKNYGVKRAQPLGGGQVGAMRGGMSTGVGSYKKGGKVKKKY